MDGLKPCPFCGASGDDINVYSFYLPTPEDGIRPLNMIYCRECGGALIDTNKNHCHLDRVKAWNRRAEA